MREVTGPIIAIALVLIAVFVPIAFISGLTGQFYKQFALTIAISTVISAFNSLTLSPALAALLLKAHGAPQGPADARHGLACSAGSSAASTRLFERGSDALRRRRAAACCSRKALAVGVYLRADRRRPGWPFKAVPGGFVPEQDKQYLVAFAQLPDGATLDRTEDVIRRMSEIALAAAGRRERGGVPGPVDQRLHQQLERGHRVRRR